MSVRLRDVLGATGVTLVLLVILSPILRPKPGVDTTTPDLVRNVADEVARMNTSRIPIHCIAFTTRDSEALLKKMANQSRGSYTYVPGVTP